MSAGSEVFFLLMYRVAAKFVPFVLFTGLTPIKTVFLKIWGKATTQECKTFISCLRSSFKEAFAELPIAFTTRSSDGLRWYKPL